MSGRSDPILIEGHAALFGVADLSGDVVRAGAFARSLRAGGVPMLLQHRQGARAGRWTRIIEDGRGLFVRGLIESEGSQAVVKAGLDGLSIGFRPRFWKPRAEGGRLLVDVELVEVSLVAAPMQPRARFSIVGEAARAA
ncbi:HK97 family phage prohead protease [Henriciella sp.]|uniref:HK97 family phage prohead protease n=1 Tax=Henriciella sp. TaxID=1968823 RepID=UPI00261ACFEA|nr:HK97 family phage prohead protease [Henriciella sp.]